MVSMKKCTVLIPCFNRTNLLKRCIQSFAESFNYVDIIVIDDGSEPAISKAEFGSQSPVSVVRIDKNVGRFSALKFGCAHVITEYILVFDSDDIWTGDVSVLRDLESGSYGWVFLTTATKGGSFIASDLYSYFYIRYLSGIRGDLKEICRADDFRSATEKIVEVNHCRVPTTLIWLLAFGDNKILFNDQVVCKKYYLAEGMSRRSLALRISNAKYMYRLYDLLLRKSRIERVQLSFVWMVAARRLIYYLVSKVYDSYH